MAEAIGTSDKFSPGANHFDNNLGFKVHQAERRMKVILCSEAAVSPPSTAASSPVGLSRLTGE